MNEQTTNCRSFIQPDLFSLEETDGNSVTTASPSLTEASVAPAGGSVSRPVRKKAPAKPALPSELTKTLRPYAPGEFPALLSDHGFDGVTYNVGIYCAVTSTNVVLADSCPVVRPLVFQDAKVRWDPDSKDALYDYRATLLYANDDGMCWQRDLVLCIRNGFPGEIGHWGNLATAHIEGFTVSAWRRCENLVFQPTLLQTGSELDAILEKCNPYAASYAAGEGLESWKLLVCPQIETLGKAGYLFIERLLNPSVSEIGAFNRLTARGSSPKTIFKTPKSVWSVLKNEPDLLVWDIFRKMEKTGNVSADSIRQAHDSRMTRAELELARGILSRTYEGKPLFSWDTLMTYFGRLDMFEAISRDQALTLLDDYLLMCSQLGIRPRTDSDSLRREHDVTARTLRQKRNEEMARKLDAVCGKNAKYDYAEGVYFVRAIRNYDDLVDEACQQNNCVASYAGRIVEGRSLIFVMRETANPYSSLITIELSPKLEIRQKLLSHNRSIRNRSQSEFIDRWVRWARTIA